MEILGMIFAYVLIYAGAAVRETEDGKVAFESVGELFSVAHIVQIVLITLGGIILINLS